MVEPTSLATLLRSAPLPRRIDKTKLLQRPPEFTLPLYNSTAYIGEDVRFGVTITVHPEPQVIWLKNGERIKPGDDDRKYTFTSDKGLYQLMIHNLDLNDDAEYMVMAHNKFGEDSCSARLTVVQHLVTEETMSVRFELKVLGVPSPTLKWEKDGYPLQFGPKVVVIKEDVDYHVLHIRETLLEDSGVYKVTATNSAGSATCQATLKVSVHKDKPFLPAKILTKPQSVTVAEGETAKFTCDIDGEPAPTVTWFRPSSGTRNRSWTHLSRWSQFVSKQTEFQVVLRFSRSE
uniref:Ig-like domain-containing protein n=1 Tax=Oryzias latipes TaxID=8090 RepID=A0A3B3ICM1_ORYLA